MQDDVAIAGADAGGGTDFAGIEFEKLAHHEDARGIFWQMGQAGVEYGPEVLVAQRAFRVTPGSRPVGRLPVGVFLEQGVEGLIQAVLVVAEGRDRRGP